MAISMAFQEGRSLSKIFPFAWLLDPNAMAAVNGRAYHAVSNATFLISESTSAVLTKQHKVISENLKRTAANIASISDKQNKGAPALFAQPLEFSRTDAEASIEEFRELADISRQCAFDLSEAFRDLWMTAAFPFGEAGTEKTPTTVSEKPSKRDMKQAAE
jgi:hypothetical protein